MCHQGATTFCTVKSVEVPFAGAAEWHDGKDTYGTYLYLKFSRESSIGPCGHSGIQAGMEADTVRSMSTQRFMEAGS